MTALGITVFMPASDGEVFADDAFDAAVGGPVAVTAGGKTVAEGTLSGATVLDRGRAVILHVDWPDGEHPDPHRG